MSINRLYTSRRDGIVQAIAESLCQINGSTNWLSNLDNQIFTTLKFWDEIEDFPSIHLNAGPETREYLGGGVKNRFLTVIIRCYVKAEDTSVQQLNMVLEDIETLLEDNSRLPYRDKEDNTQYTQQITIVSIDTDEGALDPIGVGEIVIEVRY